ncbi:RNase adapter RapZ [Undibacterium sp. RTI2.1]|uniref:RNase adapter RapZ n=1 Tax=unclassified Undibacterium TaxID=2630295 RepID=UPI002AB55BF0|nr:MULTISPECIES: RNase adapter RapZ [unclassified Undibacterium]MDY7540299.1 RNase adapter RapZ [Undibacterium sp. 5I1]MEB0029907.1 RNase adapter RapZ [Undibacterium sp. RTI2.1]MEB0118085.1 RNase adapter RapZ [Undibacterium sp. RTI2.2]MEB0231284.1 RNase adapter RapZ [Undibacterium sp. 10I3]MEB0259049.1 RNase adapter RapZ [Undibacterium sp. 5I1]
MRILLISGISGSGKSVALNVVEDAGFYCVDNLPPSLLPGLISTLISEGIQSTAVAIDSRSAHLLTSLPSTIQTLRNEGHEVKILFLTASTESLVARFSETRRTHPLSHRLQRDHAMGDRLSLMECIREEREILSPIQLLAHVIDTSSLSANTLRDWVKTVVQIEHAPLVVMFESFAFKIGVPLDADFVFDVRMLPNPHYDIQLRLLTGLDLPVIEYLNGQMMVHDLYEDIRRFIEKWLPSFKSDNRSYLTVAIGCTGGQHRSVYMVEKLAEYFKKTEQVLVRHRRIG